MSAILWHSFRRRKRKIFVKNKPVLLAHTHFRIPGPRWRMCMYPPHLQAGTKPRRIPLIVQLTLWLLRGTEARHVTSRHVTSQSDSPGPAGLPYYWITRGFRHKPLSKLLLNTSPNCQVDRPSIDPFQHQVANCVLHKVVHNFPQSSLNIITFICALFTKCGARGSVVGWGAMLQAGRSRVQVPMGSLDFFQLT
jgi:hypothetical protein